MTRHLRVWAAVAAFVLGLIAIALYARSGGVFAASLLFSLAATAGGAFLGFLFGVPRTLASDEIPPDDIQKRTRLFGIRPNTNLEQISDWLTKILVGVTLTQLGNIPSGAARLFNSMAPALGGKSDSGVLAGGIVIYFSALGFLSGWILTRLFLAKAMSAADVEDVREALEKQLERAEADHDQEKTRRLRSVLAEFP